MTPIRCPLREAAEISGNLPALIREGLTLTYQEYNLRVSCAAHRLTQLGIGEGDRVAIFLHPDWTYPIVLMGILRAGAVACPIDVRLPRQGLMDALSQINCTQLVAALRSGEETKQMAGLRVINHEYLAEASEEDLNEPLSPRIPLERPATIVFTSGSSGTAKAALHTYGNHYYSAKGSNANIHVVSKDRWLLNLPLHHVSGLSILFRCIIGGATVVLPATGQPLHEAIEEYEITHASLVGTQLRRLLKEPPSREARDRLKAILVGGGAVPEDLVAASLRGDWPLFTTYGLTEMASQVTCTTRGTPPPERPSSGQLLHYRQLKIADDGEILVRGETLFRGYARGDDTERPFDADGWFATGDMGDLDDQGYLRVSGRRDNLFISGGENIHPEEIEQALAAAAGVERVMVVPIPDAEFGARPVAFVATTQDAPLKTETILKGLASILPRFKLPAAIYAWPEDLQQTGLKPSRVLFQERALSLQAGG